MSTLTDRYVWAVIRSVPDHQRAELEPEVRALVADAIEAQSSDRPADPGAAERAALSELGDPGALAARYTDRTQYLIGPKLFPEWRRLLTILLPVVPPIVGAVVLAANLLSGATVGYAIVTSLGTGFMVALQITFWMTLVFAVIERTTGTTGLEHTWSVDDLPELPDPGRIGIAEIVATIVFDALIIVGLLWVQLQPPIVIDGEAFPLFDPALWSFWLPYFLVVTGLEIVLMIAIFMRGRWTYAFATLNALLGAAFAIPAVYLMQNGLLFNEALVSAIDDATGGRWFDYTVTLTAAIILLVVGFDALDGFMKARRAANPVVTTGVAGQ